MANVTAPTGELMDKTFTGTALVTSTNSLQLERGSSLTLFVTVQGNAVGSQINLGVQSEHNFGGGWFDLSLVSTDFDDSSAKVIPFTFRFDGDVQKKVRIPIDISGASRVRVTGQSNDSAGSLQVEYRLTNKDATGEVA